MDLSIIIVNYNGRKYLSDCLESIYKMCDGIDYEIIIWDNHSTDDSMRYLEDHHADRIKLFNSKENLGFAGGNNAGAKHATGNYLLLLNNDTVLLDNPSPAIDVLKNDHVGVVGIKMLGSNKAYRFSAGRFPSPIKLFKLSLLFEKRGGFKTGDFHSETPLKVDWIEGSFLLTKRKVWQQLHGLDERYFMYAEDIDYCKRVNNLGLHAMYVPSISYIHHGGYSVQRQHMLKKSLHLYVDIHLNSASKIWSKLALWINFNFKNVKKAFKEIT
ncbi:glycosyltransferase family 2 protein [Psychroserpens sp. BH13MA-6]